MSSDQHVPLLKKRFVTESETTAFSDEEKRVCLIPAGTEFYDKSDVVDATKQTEELLNDFEKWFEPYAKVGKCDICRRVFKEFQAVKSEVFEVFGKT